MAYLEQSTRYVPYTDKLHGRWRYHVPAEVEGALRERYVATMDAAFETYASLDRRRCRSTSPRAIPRAPQDSEGVHRAAIRAKALDTLRGHAAGGDAVERRHLRHRPGLRSAAAPDAGASARGGPRSAADQMLAELRKLIPAFLTRVDQPERGGRWSEYLAAHARRDGERRRGARSPDVEAEPRDEVTLTDFDPDGEIKIVAAALYAVDRSAGRPAAGARRAA